MGLYLFILRNFHFLNYIKNNLKIACNIGSGNSSPPGKLITMAIACWHLILLLH